MSRTFVYQTLVNDTVSEEPGSLGKLGLKSENVYAGDVDAPRGDRFLILRFGVMTPGMGGVNRTNLVVWGYERGKDHMALEKVLYRVRVLLERVEAARTMEGWITTIEWTGDSEDLIDDAYHARGRNSGYQLIDSGR